MAISGIAVIALMPLAVFAEGGDVAIYKKFIDFQWSIIGALGAILVGILVFFFKNVWGDIKELKEIVGNMNIRFEKMDNKFERMDNKFEKMDDRFEKIDERFEKMDNRFEKMEGRFEKMEGGFEKMNNRLAGIEAVLPILKDKILGLSASPMRLTEVGEKVLNKSGCRQYLEDNKGDLLKQFDDAKTPFDVEEKAKDIIRNSRKEMDSYIDKDFMHDDGKSFDDVVFVLSIELRDMVLNARGKGGSAR